MYGKVSQRDPTWHLQRLEKVLVQREVLVGQVVLRVSQGYQGDGGGGGGGGLLRGGEGGGGQEEEDWFGHLGVFGEGSCKGKGGG